MIIHLSALLALQTLSGCDLLGGKGPLDSDDTGQADTDTDTDAYVFAAIDGSFTRVDRAGFADVNMLLIGGSDAYNQGDPTDDMALAFGAEIVGGVAAWHAMLDDDLAGLGLTPCTEPGDGSGTCIAQLGPLIIPDTLILDTTSTAGFPNGRLLTDPVTDVVLAVSLLDLSTHPADIFVGLLNPAANDVAFRTDFPYVAAPH